MVELDADVIDWNDVTVVCYHVCAGTCVVGLAYEVDAAVVALV